MEESKPQTAIRVVHKLMRYINGLKQELRYLWDQNENADQVVLEIKNQYDIIVAISEQYFDEKTLLYFLEKREDVKQTLIDLHLDKENELVDKKA